MLSRSVAECVCAAIAMWAVGNQSFGDGKTVLYRSAACIRKEKLRVFVRYAGRLGLDGMTKRQLAHSRAGAAACGGRPRAGWKLSAEAHQKRGGICEDDKRQGETALCIIRLWIVGQPENVVG